MIDKKGKLKKTFEVARKTEKLDPYLNTWPKTIPHIYVHLM